MSDRPIFCLSPRLLVSLVALSLGACTVGPDFVAPHTAVPPDWTTWRSGDISLHQTVKTQNQQDTPWWQKLGDPTLNQLERQALAAAPDLQTALLHFVQARVQKGIIRTEQTPRVSTTASVTRQRISENGTSARQLELMGADRERLMKLMSQPFNFYQVGVDASWEPDLWGRIHRSLEAADADIAKQAALLELARISLSCDVALHYFSLQTTRRNLRLLHHEISTLESRLTLQEAQVRGGISNASSLEQEQADLSALKAQAPDLLAQEAAELSHLTRLLGTHPGALRKMLQYRTDPPAVVLPDLALGLPAEVANRRPDIRAAEARLRKTTASIGVARAELYPDIRLGTHLGFESYLSGELTDWSSRTWSIGPVINLPLFDHGRRRQTVQLRELEQQEAAVAYHQTVLQAWSEIDDALNTYTAQRQRVVQLTSRVTHTSALLELAQARRKAGTINDIAVLDSQLKNLLARRDLITGQGRLVQKYVIVMRVTGPQP